jgi:hypothetical protein
MSNRKHQREEEEVWSGGSCANDSSPAGCRHRKQRKTGGEGLLTPQDCSTKHVVSDEVGSDSRGSYLPGLDSVGSDNSDPGNAGSNNPGLVNTQTPTMRARRTYRSLAQGVDLHTISLSAQYGLPRPAA